jgi:hypothetical protein
MFVHPCEDALHHPMVVTDPGQIHHAALRATIGLAEQGQSGASANQRSGRPQ